MIKEVKSENIKEAAEVYSVSWIESHRDICSNSFLMIHSPEVMEEKIRAAIKEGWKFYLYLSPEPLGIISIRENEISTLYVHPEMERKGIGSELLSFAERIISSSPFLWCRKDNRKAISFYEKRGYVITEEKVINKKMTEVKLLKS